jgi:putative flippase GtrA
MNEIQRFIIFGLIGVLNSGLDIVLWKLFSLVLKKNKNSKISGNAYTIAHILAFPVAVLFSFFMNSAFTFGDSKVRDSLQVIRFFAVSVFTWLVTSKVFDLLIKQKDKDWVKRTSQKVEKIFSLKPDFVYSRFPLICKLAVIVVSMVANYIGYRLLVF